MRSYRMLVGGPPFLTVPDRDLEPLPTLAEAGRALEDILASPDLGRVCDEIQGFVGRAHAMAENDDTSRPQPVCGGCGKHPRDIPEYRDAADEAGLTADEYVRAVVLLLPRLLPGEGGFLPEC